MSGSQEKRRRQEQRAEGTEKRQVKELEIIKKKKKNRKIVSIVAAIAVILFAFAIFINSNYVRRNFAAVEVGDIDFSVVECNYYYYSAYYNYYTYVNTYYTDYAGSMLPDRTLPFDSQIYSEDTGETWADFFDTNALEDMQKIAMLYSEADDAGYTLTAEDSAEMESTIEKEKSYATASDFASFDDYLIDYYGKGMTEEIYRKSMEMQYIGTGYSKLIYDSFTYTDEELESYYSENADSLDVINYRYFLVSADTIDETLYDDEDALAEAKAEALAEAKIKADTYLAEITDEASFETAAVDCNPDLYGEPDSTLSSYKGELLGSYYKDWLIDDSRQYGETTVTDGINGYYVLYFISHDDNHYNTVNVRHILISPETIDEADYPDDEAGYNAAVAEAIAAAQQQAEEVYQEWLDGDATEASFGELADQYSDDTSAGGLYEKVYRNQMVREFNDWSFDPTRKAADTEIVHSEDYGYHIMYFIGEDQMYSDALSEDALREADYTAWETEKSENYSANTNWIYILKE